MDGGRVLEGILLDLEGAGYSWEVYAIPACGVGAPHRRYRVWIVAHNNDIGCERDGGSRGWREGFEDDDRVAADPKSRRRSVWPSENGGSCEGEINAFGNEVDVRSSPDHAREGLEGIGIGRGVDKEGWKEPDGYGSECDSAFSHAERTGLERRERVHESACPAKPDWSEHWLEVAARLCRVDDGIPAGVDGIGELPAEQKAKKKSAGRSHRLEALGNAIVPQVVYEIFMAINEYEKASPHLHP